MNTNPYEIFTDPAKLYFLYESTYSTIVNLRKLMDKNLDNALNDMYRIKLVEAETNFEQIKKVIQGLTEGECISLERLLYINEEHKGPMIVWFKEETQAHSTLGPSIKGKLELTPKEKQELLNNLKQNIRTYGQVKIKPDDPLKYSEKQLEFLQSSRIETCEINEIW